MSSRDAESTKDARGRSEMREIRRREERYHYLHTGIKIHCRNNKLNDLDAPGWLAGRRAPTQGYHIAIGQETVK
jgi:hypothetical protein